MHSFTRRTNLAGLFLILATIVAAAEPSRPNIIFILADDLGWKDVGYAGSKFYRTPHLDRLSREGVQFTQAYSAACVCSPSRGAIFSGKNPARTAVTTVWGGQEGPDDRLHDRSKNEGGVNQYLEAPHRHALPKSERTFADVLTAAGYMTGFWGKWHLGECDNYQPPDRGFLHAQGYRMPAAGGGTRGHWGNSYPVGMLANLPDLKPGDYISDVLTTETVKFIHTHRRRPFLAVLSHYLVHAPIQAKPELVPPYVAARKFDQRNPDYAAMIESLDHSVGRILQALDETGLAANTLVVFTSDNGGLSPRSTSNFPLMGGKSFPFEAGMRVPLVMRWPAIIQPGSTCRERVTGMDFFPTFLEVAGLPAVPQQHRDGVSLRPLFSGRDRFPARPLVFHFPHYTHATGPNSVLIENNWKLIRFYNDEAGRHLLFDLAEDPFEQRDLSAVRPEKVRALEARLTELLAGMQAQMPRKNPKFDPSAPRLFNRPFTLNLALEERQMFSARMAAPVEGSSPEPDVTPSAGPKGKRRRAGTAK